MTIRGVLALSMVGALAFAPASALAADKNDKAAADTSANKMASGDKKFVNEALQGGMAEVELGKLASEKAANDSVKQFGKRMVDDHGKAGDELKKLAQDKGVTPPAEMDSKHKKLHDRLSKLSGAEFDRAYVNEMVKDHRKDVKDFQREADKAKDPDLKSWAAKTLPTLQDHLKQVEDINTQMKGTAKADKK